MRSIIKDKLSSIQAIAALSKTTSMKQTTETNIITNKILPQSQTTSEKQKP